VLFFGVINRLPFRSRVRSKASNSITKDSTVHRYVIACEFYRASGAADAADTIRRLASHWEHPLSGLWIVETAFTAGDIRAAMLAQLDSRDRVYIREAGADTAEFNTVPASGEKVTQIAEARVKSRMLAAIFSRNGKRSRHLMAATSGNLKSA
jgi:hypothetical protein